MLRLYPIIFLIVFSSVNLFSQAIKGKVVDLNNQPVPYANVYVKNSDLSSSSTTGTSTDAKGEYYFTILPGNYTIVVSSVGYTTVEIPVIVKDNEVVQNFILELEAKELDQVIVRAARKDPAYEVIQKAIENREKNQQALESYSVNVYIKASENRDASKRTIKSDESNGALEISDFEEELDKEKDTLNLPPNLSIHESNIELHVKKPDDIKEIKKASKTTGTNQGLFIPNFYRDQIDFYDGLVHPKKITETPWISPLNKTSILTYKFKLEGIYYEDSLMVYNIKVTPRKSGNSTLNGNIHIVDSTWNILKVDLGIKKGGLLFFDKYNITQEYQKIEAGWQFKREEHTYSTKSGKKDYEGNTVIRYSGYRINPTFPDDFFGNEVGYVEKDAYEKDTTYWKESRPEELTKDQMRAIAYNDSVQAVLNSEHYLDSMTTLYNKVKIMDLLYFGVGFRNREKERSVRFSSIGESVNPLDVGGFRINPSFTFNKVLHSQKRFNFWVAPSYGLRNKDLKGTVSAYYAYNPFNFSGLHVAYNNSFDFINQNDAYIEMLRRSNFFERKSLRVTHYFEPYDGFRLYTMAEWNRRQSIEGYEFGDLSERVLNNQDPTIFDNHIGFTTNIGLSYTPAQKYYTEPDRRIILGSKFPTFTIRHIKGWEGIAGSILDYDFLEFSIDQRIDIRSLGSSTYSIKTGKFVNTNVVRILDYKRFRRGDPILFSDPKNTFQLLDQSFELTSLFYEGHYNHKFNGALINNIPLVKKLRFRATAGGGFLYIPDESYQYGEFYAGIERIFKLGPRRRLKVGGYGVLGQSNRTNLQLGWKVSFDIIDTWQTNWNF